MLGGRLQGFMLSYWAANMGGIRRTRGKSGGNQKLLEARTQTIQRRFEVPRGHLGVVLGPLGRRGISNQLMLNGYVKVNQLLRKCRHDIGKAETKLARLLGGKHIIALTLLVAADSYIAQRALDFVVNVKVAARLHLPFNLLITIIEDAHLYTASLYSRKRLSSKRTEYAPQSKRQPSLRPCWQWHRSTPFHEAPFGRSESLRN